MQKHFSFQIHENKIIFCYQVCQSITLDNLPINSPKALITAFNVKAARCSAYGPMVKAV